MGFPGDLDCKASACNAGDPGSVPGSGRSPGEGFGNLLQYFFLENLVDRIAWWANIHGDTTEQLTLSLTLSSSLTTNEMQIKITMYYHLISARMTIIKKIRDSKHCEGSRDERILSTVGGNVNWFSHYGKKYDISSKN